ncbi:YraN family protein [Wohlfahrtiimonas larvae]|uniref:UPF0102 protein GCM10023338_07660 n=1 Tax=Wohlfahrtiimonas larvae TaxID=1157986 RepID=A0ABP9MNF2_9GAMM|nr:YraN family protein [Wohlfahrtiimonas larvae]
MSEPQIIGTWGENLAREYLESQGLHFVMRNYLCKMGEIDLIMQDNQTLIFVEVRVRNTKLHGNPLESITVQKQRKVRKTAERYLQQVNHQGGARIDVIGIDTSMAPPVITWVENAF